VADLCTNGSLFNPWEMDMKKVMTSLTAGKFSKTGLKAAAKPVTVGGASGSYFQAYIPAAVVDAESAEFSFGYLATADNTVFDGDAVFLVCPPPHPGTTGLVNYQLTRMP
jgi:hypothetical protein